MSELMEQLYKGQVIPSDQIIIVDPKAKEIDNCIDIERDYLKSVLPDEAISHLEELENQYLKSLSLDCYAGFSYGFKMGIQLMHEVFITDKKAPLDTN